MNFHRPNFVAAARWFSVALLLLVICVPVLRAAQEAPTRWLLVFDTSSSMKKILPATLSAAGRLLTTGANGQIHEGDSVAVWLYGRQLLTNQLPPIPWTPARCQLMSSNFSSFLKRQKFEGESSLPALRSPLHGVVSDSERLTVVIFCDGQSKSTFTPYDEGINQNFRDGLTERKKSGQPFVVVLRSQQGKFIGCTVGYPPASLNFPEFPPLPLPVVTNVPPPVAKVEVPPLVIIGTKVGTNLNAVAEIVKPPVKPVVVAPTNPPAAASVPATNPPVTSPPATVVAPPVLPPTNIVKVAETNPVKVASVPVPVVTQAVAAVATPAVQTNVPPVAASQDKDRQTSVLIFIGVALLVAAVVLVVVIVRMGRRPRASLISSSMDGPPRK